MPPDRQSLSAAWFRSCRWWGPDRVLSLGPMSRVKELAKRVLPDRFARWYRRKRGNILEAAGGAATITPRVLLRGSWRKTAPIRAFFRRVARKLVPQRML